MTKEQIYDDQMADKLLEIGQICAKHNISFFAAVEYDKDKIAETKTMAQDAGLAINMIRLCASSATNFDSYVIKLKKYCYENNIDISQSICMKLLNDN